MGVGGNASQVADRRPPGVSGGRPADVRVPLLRWWHLSRPAGLWLPPLLPLLGYGWAHWDRALLAWNLADLPWVLAGWAALQAGTLWLNASRDQDIGEVLLGRAVPVPPGTDRLALVALASAIGLATAGSVVSGACCAAAAGLAILYSHPRTAWKAHPVLGPLVNVVGYGILSPAAGYALVGTPPTPRTALVLALLACAVLGWTFAAQAFQRDEDRARGDRTLVATHGPRVTLGAARACMGLAGLGMLLLAARGWLPPTLLVVAPLVALTDLWLVSWARQPDGGSERWARGLVVLGTLTIAVAMAATTASYLDDSWSGRPVAGLGTPDGHPRDRLRLPASQLRVLDAADRVATGRPYRPR